MPPRILEEVISLDRYPVNEDGFSARCRDRLEAAGSLLLPNFVSAQAIETLAREASAHARLAYYCRESHTVYLSAADPDLDPQHPRNRLVVSSKGCITDDQIPEDSLLKFIYDHPDFRRFLCRVLGEAALYEYADPLSSVNIHYYQAGQELGWHFDNSSFAVTLMIQQPGNGGVFEYIPGLRNHEQGDMNFEGVENALDGRIPSIPLAIESGTLALFRGRNSMHRVTPVEGPKIRIQAVLAYNTEPGIALSEQARRTFYGRTH